MDFHPHPSPGGKIVLIAPEETFETLADITDRMATAMFDGFVGLVVPKECLPEDFFRLRTGLAGEVLQKFTTYQMKIAIIGDFDGYASESLAAFIRESNRGRQVFFKPTVQEGMEAIWAAM